MSSVGSSKVAFWAVRDAGASSGEVAAGMTAVVRRARFRDMMPVDMDACGAGRRILGRYSDERR